MHPIQRWYPYVIAAVVTIAALAALAHLTGAIVAAHGG